MIVKKIKHRLHSYYRKAVQVLEPVAAISGFTSALYYLFFSSSFRREQQAVLKGKLHYRRALRNPGESSYLLRRNIHRLEKGLIMEPRRPVFARDYIDETVRAYATVLNVVQDHERSTELHWAQDILEEYFSVVGAGDAKVDAARERYQRLSAKGATNLEPLKPYTADRVSSRPVTPEQFAELCRVRRSVRWYDGQPVPREAIDRAIAAAGTAPSACNRQPFRYIIFDEQPNLSEVAAIPMGTTGFSDNFPALAVLVGDLAAYFDERDRHVIYIDGSLSAMTFMFALQTEGIASCSINWPDIKDREAAIRDAIALKPSDRVIMLVSLGYARGGGQIPASTKKPLEQLRSYNQTHG